ncbi:RNA polymerase sigma factor SigZ [uncultured Chitinophaga sp.]|jgi:RNA polymerase sigma factor, SigZ family|uniref:RNA polymerase sigma factor SigZ n=1 Tax=uncultured Chitinophaga sp. TaxID=339340 RepID=UPI002605C977|nr:RNA polymerase sigma factor SigZ [uncultured Chitinophaga sp.]
MQQSTIPLWGQFNTELKRFICRKTGHEDHCQDLLQDLYLKIFVNQAKIEKAQNVRAYIFQMAHNVLTDHHRRTARKNVLSADAIPDLELATEEPGQEYSLAGCLRSMIDTLPEIYRQALISTELDGLTQKQFAEKVGISLSGAKSRVQRAREKLKEEILKCCRYEFDKYGNIISCCGN